MADLKADNLTKLAKDALYITVGLGLIAFQKAQVQRREATKAVRSEFADTTRQLETLFDQRIKVVEERIDDVLELVGRRNGSPASR